MGLGAAGQGGEGRAYPRGLARELSEEPQAVLSAENFLGLANASLAELVVHVDGYFLAARLPVVAVAVAARVQSCPTAETHHAASEGSSNYLQLHP